MKSAALIGLVVVTVALAGVTWFVVRPRGEESAAIAGAPETPFLPDFGAKVNTAKTVIVKSGDKEFTIQQDEAGVWRMADKGDYPANMERVKQVLAGLADLRGGEPKTSRPELYSKIGVQEPGGKPAEPGERSPSLLTVKDSGGQVLASVIVGNSKYGAKQGVYIRRSGETQSWLATGTLDVPGEPAAWIETKILELPRDRVKGVTITHADGNVLVVSREKPSDTAFTVHDVPPGKELKSPNVGDPLGAGLSYLQFDDVMPAASLKTEGEGAAKAKWTADYRTFDGLVLVIQAFEKDAKTWAKIVATFDDTAVAPTENRPPALKSGEEALKEVTDLSARLSPWAFQLPDWKAQALAATMASMLKETPPAPPPGMTGTTGAPEPMSLPPAIPPASPPAPPAEAPKPAPTGATGSTGSTGPTGEPKPG